jgi:hypothetical protein
LTGGTNTLDLSLQRYTQFFQKFLQKQNSPQFRITHHPNFINLCKFHFCCARERIRKKNEKKKEQRRKWEKRKRKETTKVK